MRRTSIIFPAGGGSCEAGRREEGGGALRGEEGCPLRRGRRDRIKRFVHVSQTLSRASKSNGKSGSPSDVHSVARGVARGAGASVLKAPSRSCQAFDAHAPRRSGSRFYLSQTFTQASVAHRTVMNPQASEFVPSWLARPAEEVAPDPEEKAQASWEDDAADAAPSEALANATISDNKPVAATLKAKESRPVAKAKENKEEESAGEGVPDKVDLDGLELDQKKPLNVVLLGHVDAGKSTISGHILVLTGNVDERTMEKYEKEAKALGRESWKFAFALDTSEQERAKGKTEECGQASFTTETRRFTILDAPGHKNYVPHMIGGASQADIGILVISARKGEFETGFERGGQTREHAMLAKTSGVRQMVVVVNKLDDPSVLNPDGTWSEERYLECKTKLEPYLRQVGWNPKGLVWIPVSGITGDNLKEKVPTSTCPWFEGEPLLHILENLRPPERLLSGPVKMPISEKHKEMGTMVMGKLESGVIKVNDKLIMMPNRVEVLVDSLQLEGSTAQAAEPGDVVRLRLKGIEEEDVRVGFVLCSSHDLVSYTHSFIARLMVLEHKSIICAGYSAVIHIHAAVEEFTVSKLLAELDKKGRAKQKNPKFVKPGMRCLVQLRTSQPICVEPYDVFPQLGRFMIRDEGKTIAVGTVARLMSDSDTRPDGSSRD